MFFSMAVYFCFMLLQTCYKTNLYFVLSVQKCSLSNIYQVGARVRNTKTIIVPGGAVDHLPCWEAAAHAPRPHSRPRANGHRVDQSCRHKGVYRYVSHLEEGESFFPSAILIL